MLDSYILEWRSKMVLGNKFITNIYLLLHYSILIKLIQHRTNYIVKRKNNPKSGKFQKKFRLLIEPFYLHLFIRAFFRNIENILKFLQFFRYCYVFLSGKLQFFNQIIRTLVIFFGKNFFLLFRSTVPLHYIRKFNLNKLNHLKKHKFLILKTIKTVKFINFLVW
uniref:Uncharacterized protein n=1 Tax=Amorphochlora amoebiformis TaxID=1561963 RepID=A0A0H5BLF7_9EUKA|nr:hypothetical protein [Amorphochlora amoebiformis]